VACMTGHAGIGHGHPLACGNAITDRLTISSADMCSDSLLAGAARKGRPSTRAAFDPTLGYPARGPVSWHRRSVTKNLALDSGHLMGEPEPRLWHRSAVMDFRGIDWALPYRRRAAEIAAFYTDGAPLRRALFRSASLAHPWREAA
jgi:hypothetical protein